jgi:hypothetical protein
MLLFKTTWPFFSKPPIKCLKMLVPCGASHFFNFFPSPWQTRILPAIHIKGIITNKTEYIVHNLNFGSHYQTIEIKNKLTKWSQLHSTNSNHVLLNSNDLQCLQICIIAFNQLIMSFSIQMIFNVFKYAQLHSTNSNKIHLNLNDLQCLYICPIALNQFK